MVVHSPKILTSEEKATRRENVLPTDIKSKHTKSVTVLTPLERFSLSLVYDQPGPCSESSLTGNDTEPSGRYGSQKSGVSHLCMLIG